MRYCSTPNQEEYTKQVNNKTQASLFHFQNPNSGCPMILRNHYGEYRVICDPARDDEPVERDQDDAADYTRYVANAKNDNDAVFAIRTELCLDADGDQL
jgi:hypothetical protein